MTAMLSEHALPANYRGSMSLDTAAILRAPFPPDQIGKLPRLTCKRCSDAQGKVCAEHRKQRCGECGNYISTAHIHLDYVGHAAITDRLLQADPAWTWTPMGYNPDGTPVVTTGSGLMMPDEKVGLWILLTVAGVTRPGFGGGKNMKEAIGDALRNAAMRFGVALDLWHKDGALQRIEPDETPARLDWGALLEAIEVRWDVQTLEAFKVFSAQARTTMFPDGNVDQAALYALVAGAAEELTTLPGEFPPPGRAELQACFAPLALDGPEWRMSPDETDRPPYDDGAEVSHVNVNEEEPDAETRPDVPPATDRGEDPERPDSEDDQR